MDTITPHAFPNPGAVDKKDDPHDIKLGAAGMPVYTHEKTLTNSSAWKIPVEYQGKQPACGAHGGSKLKHLAIGSRFSPRFTWGDLKTFDGWPIDSGTDIRSVMKSITKTGVLDFAQYGNDVDLSEIEYAQAPTDRMRAFAGRFSGQGYGFITDLSFDGLKQFISDHGPAVILIRLSERFWKDAHGNISWAEKDILPLVPASSLWPTVSGHFVVAHSFDEQYVYFLNCWGDTWGRKGHGYFGMEFMPQVVDAGALFALSFKKDLMPGMTDPDVKALQQYLNAHGFVVSMSGDGSTGNETAFFGPKTTQALQAMQRQAGLVSSGTPTTTGYGRFGPLTRAWVQQHP